MKTPLIERMEKAKAPKTWVREVKTKETYLNIIDRLAREKEQLESENECLETELDNVRDAHEKLEVENVSLRKQVKRGYAYIFPRWIKKFIDKEDK